jgi:hypothetical protein
MHNHDDCESHAHDPETVDQSHDNDYTFEDAEYDVTEDFPDDNSDLEDDSNLVEEFDDNNNNGKISIALTVRGQHLRTYYEFQVMTF